MVFHLYEIFRCLQEPPEKKNLSTSPSWLLIPELKPEKVVVGGYQLWLYELNFSSSLSSD